MSQVVAKEVVAQLAPTGVLRAGINMGNFLLVTGKTASGDPQGVAPDMAAEIAKRLNVPVAYVKYERPSQLADAGGHIGRDPLRIPRGGFAGDQEEIAHIDPGAQDAGWGKFGCDLAHVLTFC